MRPFRFEMSIDHQALFPPLCPSPALDRLLPTPIPSYGAMTSIQSPWGSLASNFKTVVQTPKPKGASGEIGSKTMSKRYG